MHADAVEERAGSDGGGVEPTRRTRLTGEVGLDGEERRLCDEIGAVLDDLIHATDALPGDGCAGNVIGGREHLEQGRRIVRVGTLPWMLHQGSRSSWSISLTPGFSPVIDR